MDEYKKIYNKYDIIISEVLSYFLSMRDNYVMKNFDASNKCHLFYYEILKMCYSLSNKKLYYKGNWFKFIKDKICIFKKENVSFYKKKNKGTEIDFSNLNKVLELDEKTLISIYFTYYYKKG